MKIENTSSNQMLQKGVFVNSDKLIKTQEIERIQSALDSKKTINSFLENRGVYFDKKA